MSAPQSLFRYLCCLTPVARQQEALASHRRKINSATSSKRCTDPQKILSRNVSSWRCLRDGRSTRRRNGLAEAGADRAHLTACAALWHVSPRRGIKAWSLAPRHRNGRRMDHRSLPFSSNTEPEKCEHGYEMSPEPAQRLQFWRYLSGNMHICRASRTILSSFFFCFSPSGCCRHLSNAVAKTDTTRNMPVIRSSAICPCQHSTRASSDQGEC